MESLRASQTSETADWVEFPPVPAVALDPTATELEWQEQRQRGIGSSDASAILGLSNWESPYSLWEQKTGRVPLDRPVSADVERLRKFGHIMESVTCSLTAEHLGIPIMKPEVGYHHAKHDWLRCNLDGWTADGRLAEFKNVHQSQAGWWDGQIPDHAEIQVHHSGIVLGATSAVVAGLIGGSRLAVYEVALSESVMEVIWEAETKFWEHVTSDTPPEVDGHHRTLENLMETWAGHSAPKQVDETDVSEWWEQFFEADREEKAAKKRKDTARARLAELMDGHDVLATGDRVWAKVQGTQLSKTRLKAAHPDVYERYMRPKKTFDLTAFKQEQPELYREYQGKTVMPKDYRED